jgi:hypothetical protein
MSAEQPQGACQDYGYCDCSLWLVVKATALIGGTERQGWPRQAPPRLSGLPVVKTRKLMRPQK